MAAMQLQLAAVDLGMATWIFGIAHNKALAALPILIKSLRGQKEI